MLTTSWLDGLDLGDPVSSDPLEGGYASKTYRVRTTLGRSVVVKTQTGLPLDLYGLEAEGLEALRSTGGFAVPEVLRVTPTFIVLADLGASEPSPTYWEDAGRALATQHEQTAGKFGYHHDNYLGVLPQQNPWSTDGHTFFAEHRLLRYLEEPKCHQALPADDRERLERLADRLPDLIPRQPPSLLHGDLWHGNLIPTPEGEPALIDPAVYYGWPEAELSMLDGCGKIPDAFFASYAEAHPLEPGWRDRLPILHLREHLCVLAHFGEVPETLGKIHTTLAAFA
ncbi:fructosamine kinase family protein [Kribbella sp. NPDC051952]|uniref:fructosamine kinase family protein n=1 Tax=Kribbella sp. NPDC051952 TaxID=3154851 RepID=UPI00344282FC